MHRNFRYGVLVFLLIADFLISLCVFPPNLVLDLLCPRVTQAGLDRMEHDYGQLVGYPAGEGIPVVSTIEEYEKIGWYKKIEGSDELGGREYFTFETDTIIPLDLYHLKSGVGEAVTSRRGYVTGRRPSMTTFPNPAERSYYDRYYLVALPDGNYVLVRLDDAYYWKYKFSGRVQLPLGCKDFMTFNEKEALAACIQEYGLDEKSLLVMSSDERDREMKYLHMEAKMGVFAISAGILIAIAWIVHKAAQRVARSGKQD